MSNNVFPTFSGMSWPVKRKPKFSTKVVAAISGKESRAAFMAYPLYIIELQFDYLSLVDWKTLGGFFKQRKGKFDSFLFNDAQDNSVTAQLIGTGDGSTVAFQLSRALGGFTEPCENINGSPSIYLNGSLQSSGYTIGLTGILTFTVAPSSGVAITWTGSYYWRVRFDLDEAEFAENMSSFFELKKLTMIGATGNKI